MWKYSLLEVELWGILDGATLVQDKEYDRVLMQTDNIKVIGVINESLSKESNSTLIKRII